MLWSVSVDETSDMLKTTDVVVAALDDLGYTIINIEMSVNGDTK